MSKLSRENTLSKMRGAGDGIKNVAKSSERIPVPSSRKFTATAATRTSEKVQMQLRKVIDDMEAKGQMKKSKTVAEITPTKSARKKAKRLDGSASATLHATPRPPLGRDTGTPPSGRQQERRRRLELLVCHRWLVFAWRRGKARQAMLSESLRRRQDQISNLEKQVECLKKLTHSECSKRGKVTEDCQRIESLLQTTKMENESLIKEKVFLQVNINDLRAKLESSAIDMENMKNEIKTQSTYTRQLEIELENENMLIQNAKIENAHFLDRVKARDAQIKSQEELLEKLNESLRDLEHRLKSSEEVRNEQTSQINRMNEQYQMQVKRHECTKHELSRVCSIKDEMMRKVDDLKGKLSKMNSEHQLLLEENSRRKRNCWWNNTKELLAVSWALIQNAAYIMLPAL